MKIKTVLNEIRDTAVVLLLGVFLIVGCTANERAKALGGTARLEVPCGQKVGNITWKENQLWYSTTPMEKDYIPQTHNFREESSYGLMEGNYILIETKCD